MILLPQKLFVLILLLLAAPALHTQVLVKIYADKDHILVGEPLKLTIEARLPLGENLNWVTLDSIPHFELTEKGKKEEANEIDGKRVQQEIMITSYDTGYWVIPPLKIKVALKYYTTDTLGIRVDYNAGFNPAEDYRDIKETEEVLVKSNNLSSWIIGGISLLLLLLLIIIFLRGKAGKKQSINTVQLSAYEEAMQAIALLRNQKKITDGEIKVFYTGLNDILRNFISKQFHLSTLEKTNDELVIQLKRLKLPSDQFTSLAQSLRMADFVKFARYHPPSTENEKSLTVIESAIISLNKPSP